MTSSSEPIHTARGLDAMLIVYSLVSDHPASTVCEEFISRSAGWFTTSLTLLEARSILTKVYGVPSKMAAEKLLQFARGEIRVIAVDGETALGAMKTAESLKIDLTDAVLLDEGRNQHAVAIGTDDGRLALACQQVGIQPECPIDQKLRGKMASWEQVNLPPKGMPRILRQVHRWLSQRHVAAADEFWSLTGSGSHLP